MIDKECPHPSVLPVSTSVVQSAYAGAYMRSVNSRMNVCISAWPVAGPYCSAVARLRPPSPWRGSRGIWTRVELSFPEPKMRQSQPSGEDETDGEVVCCVVSGNASGGRMSAETEVKGKYSGLGRPARRCRVRITQDTTNDKRTTGKGNQVFVKVFLEALERGQTISTRKVRKVVGVV